MAYRYYSYELAPRMVYSSNYTNMVINHSYINCVGLYSGLEGVKMEKKVFEDEHGRKVIVKVNRSNIQIHTEKKEIIDYRFYLDSDEILHYLKEQAIKIWKSFCPKEADSFGADYSEFYDKTTDNNGYLDYRNEMLIFESPSEKNTLLYQFNKRRMESFIYDMESWFDL